MNEKSTLYYRNTYKGNLIQNWGMEEERLPE